MNKQEFLQEYKAWESKWREVDKELVELVNKYMEETPDDERLDFDGLDYNGEFSRSLDNLAERRGWVEDRLNDRSWSNRKATKRIRKALGYTIP